MNDSKTIIPTTSGVEALEAAKEGLPKTPSKACCDAKTNPQPTDKAKEIGGRDGPDPTRYGDWENKGRCVDF